LRLHRAAADQRAIESLNVSNAAAIALYAAATRATEED
jgi:tRNA G18 (ribose-2'-O)-methylase SpoU